MSESPRPVRYDDLPTTDTDVLVVGAGPTGLMAGLVLTRAGVGALTIDGKAGPTRESRALAVQARTMEIYDQLGLADHVVAHAVGAPRVRMGEGRPPLEFGPLQEGDTRFPGVRIFEQSRNEEMLSAALEKDGARVWWRHSLVGFTEPPTDEGGVSAVVNGPDGLLRVRARWCVGADGAGSLVRRLVDLPFEGVTDEATFWVADVHEVSGLDDSTVSFRFGTETFSVAFPLGPGGHVRLVALARTNDITEDEAMAGIRDDLGLRHGKVDWFSTYRVHHRRATHFRVGPVFLAGDAAHVHSPVGGQGMNTGLQDAHNLALLLADVFHGRAEATALDRYEAERLPVARTLVGVTDRAFGVIARPGRVAGVLRQRASAIPPLLFMALRGLPAGRRVAGWLGQYRIHYRFATGSPPPPWAADPLVGRRLPPAHNNHVPLRELTWQLHTYGGEAPSMSGLPSWVAGPHRFPVDPDGRFAPDRAYLIRPDGFVAAAIPCSSNGLDADVLRAAVGAHRLVGEI